MGLFKRAKYWHFDFIYRGKRFQGSTGQTNINQAKIYMAKVRADAAMEARGLAPPKEAPGTKDFLENRFLDHVREHNANKPATIQFYRVHVKRLLKHKPFANSRLSHIDEELISAYRPNGTIATINGDLRTMSKALKLALEWKLIQREVKVHNLPGEHKRTFVLSIELEARYLALCPYPLKQAAVLMLDLGLRPEECVSLRKTDVIVEGGAAASPPPVAAQDGWSGRTIHAIEITGADARHTRSVGFNSAASIIVRGGKSVNAARSLPLTERAKGVVEFMKALWPNSKWLFPGRQGKHLHRGSLDNLQAQLKKHYDLPKDLILYTARHTFGTRMAESGAHPFDIMKAMGHSSIAITQRYVHISADHLRVSMRQKELRDERLRGEVHDEATSSKER